MYYTVMSVMPYSGFIALHLLNKNEQEEELQYTETNIGPYAGMLVSAFKISSFFTSILWGKCADVYGRKFVLTVGGLALVAGNIGFGLSSSFRMACLFRFLMGILNATMVIAKTSISEIAYGDPKLESKGIGILITMRGFATLIAPAMGGLLSEPLKQYPQLFRHFGEASSVTSMLEHYPFVIPNLIGAVFSLVSLIIVVLAVEETIPREQLHDWTQIPQHSSAVIRKSYSKLSPLLVSSLASSSSLQSLMTYVADTEDDNYDDDDDDSQMNTTITETTKLLMIPSGEPIVGRSSPSSSSPTTPMTRSMSLPIKTKKNKNNNNDKNTYNSIDVDTDIHTAADIEEDHYVPYNDIVPVTTTTGSRAANDAGISQPTVVDESIPKKKTDYWYMYSHWCYSFSSSASSETFPLFAMAALSQGGLGYDEKTIGMVQTLGGIFFLLFQYRAFSYFRTHFTVLVSLRLGALCRTITLLFFPLSMYCMMYHTDSNDTSTTTKNYILQFIYCGIVLGGIKIFGGVYDGHTTMGMNASITKITERASMNAIVGTGDALGRGLGPIFSGYLVATIMTPTLSSSTPSSSSSSSSFSVPSTKESAAWIVYSILFVVGLLFVASTMMITDTDHNKDSNESNYSNENKEERRRRKKRVNIFDGDGVVINKEIVVNNNNVGGGDQELCLTDSSDSEYDDIDDDSSSEDTIGNNSDDGNQTYVQFREYKRYNTII